MSDDEQLARHECESLMDVVMKGALDWLKQVSQQDVLAQYFLSFPIDVEVHKLDELANAPFYQIVGRLEYFTMEANKRQSSSSSSRSRSRSSTAAAAATTTGLAQASHRASSMSGQGAITVHTRGVLGQTAIHESNVPARARANDDRAAMTRPDSSSSEDTNMSPVMPTHWPPRMPSVAEPASSRATNAPAMQSSTRRRPDPNANARNQTFDVVRGCGEEFIRRCARIKAKQIEGYGRGIEQESYADVKMALERNEMGPKACYDWIRNIDEEDE